MEYMNFCEILRNFNWVSNFMVDKIRKFGKTIEEYETCIMLILPADLFELEISKYVLVYYTPINLIE